MLQRIEAGGGLAHAGVPGDQPVVGEHTRQPLEDFILHDVVLLGQIWLSLDQDHGSQRREKANPPVASFMLSH